MSLRIWTTISAVIVLAGLIVVGCRRLQTQQPPALPPNASRQERELARAEALAKLGNWEAAGPLFRRLEAFYKRVGDTRNELYARVSRYRAEIEVSDLQRLSEELRLILQRPDVQSDLGLKQRCLETKGNIDLNLDGVSARPSFEELERVATAREDAHAASRASGELGILAFLEGNPSEAKSRVVKAIGKAVWYGDRGAQIRYLSLLGQGMAENKGASQALYFLNAATTLARSTPDADFPKIATSGKASALTQLGRFDEAQRVVNEGLQYARQKGYVGFQVDMLAQAGQLATARKDITGAIDRYEQAASLALSIHFNRGVAEVNAHLAELYQRAGDLQKAHEAIAVSIRAHRELGEVYVLPHHLAVQAGIETALGKFAAAEGTYQTAERVVGTMLQNTPTPGLKRAVIASMSEVFTGHFQLAVRQHNLKLAYQVIEEARGRVAADRLQAGEQMQSISRPDMASRERRLALVQMQLLDTDDPNERKGLSEALVQLETQLSSEEVATVTGETKRFGVADLQRVLRADETVLEYVLGDVESHCLVITARDVTVATLPNRASLESKVESFLSAVKKEAAAKQEGRELFAAAVGPVAKHLTENVIVIADGGLHRVPFAALSEDGERYLVQDHSITYAPSGSVLTILRNRQAAGRADLFAVGNVPYVRDVSAQERRPWRFFRGLDQLHRRSMGNLPGTEDELRTVRAVLRDTNGVVLTGERATETNVKSGFRQRFLVVHLAVHAFADKVYPDRAALVFASDPAAGEDGLLQAREIRRLALADTNLVTLSACDTSSGRVEGQEGVNSIVYAFLYAGARSAVASFWPAEDSATSQLMKAFYSHLANRTTKAESLRIAQLELLRQGGDMSKPLYWAGFNLTGEGQETIERNSHDDSRTKTAPWQS